MADPTREEYDAKLEAVEARLETRLMGIDGKLDRLFDRVDYAANQAREARSAATNIKWNILFTAIGSIAVLFAAFALWAQGVEMVGALLSAKPD